jgi:tetratricopeptide (TPR) repeat protein
MVWAVALLVALAQSPDYSADGMKALDARDYGLAAQLFTKAVEADPKDYSAHFNLALAWSMAGQDERAIPEYKKTLELKPGLYQAELNLGMVLLRQKQPQEAAPLLEAAAGAKPQEFRPRLLLADALYSAGDFAKAAEAYQAAVALDAKSAQAVHGLARSEVELGKLTEAEGHFVTAAQLDPSLADAVLELAPRYEKNGQKEEAIALYARFPENPGARERMALLLTGTGRAAEAIPHLEWVAAKSPTPANLVALAQAYKQNKQVDKAMPLFERAVAMDPGNPDLRMAYGRELRDQLQYTAAAAQFEWVAMRRPDSVEAWNEFAAMLISSKDDPRALAALEKLRSLGAETPGHLYLRAMVLDRINDDKTALEYYRKFLAVDQGKNPEQEFMARHRAAIIERKLRNSRR